MLTLQKKQNSELEDIKSFSYPRLVTGKEWYIIFYAFDPAKDQMRRKRVKLNHIPKVGDRRKYADGLMKRLIKKLEDGWNPWIEAENAKAYHTFADVCDHYRKSIDKLLKDDILRIDTHRDYVSKLRNIEQWNTEVNKEKIIYIYQFNRSIVTDFLEHIYVDRSNTPQTRNNYLTFIRIFSSFLLQSGYANIKPSDGITSLSKRKMKKHRTIIDNNDIIRLYDFLDKENKHFLLSCYILHYYFVRRKEMSYIKISDISLSRKTLFVPEDSSKNGSDGTVTLPVKVIHLMLELEIFNQPGNFYLFSDNFKPGKVRKHEKQFTDYWVALFVKN